MHFGCECLFKTTVLCSLAGTVFTASGQTKAVHHRTHCARFADAFGGAGHDDFATKNFPVCKLERSVSRQSNQIWLASSCILGQDSVEVRCRKCDEAAGEGMKELAQSERWTRWGSGGTSFCGSCQLHFAYIDGNSRPMAMMFGLIKCGRRRRDYFAW